MILGYKHRPEEWEWHRWFAWKPVRMINKPGRAWLRVVQRSRFRPGPGTKWIYREIKP